MSNVETYPQTYFLFGKHLVLERAIKQGKISKLTTSVIEEKKGEGIKDWIKMRK